MLARELIEKYDIDVSRLSDPEYAAEVEKRIADTSWVYVYYEDSHILYDASQYKIRYHGKYGYLEALEGVAERGEVYHTILGATKVPSLFSRLYKRISPNTQMVIKFEEGFADNLKLTNFLHMGTSFNVWFDLSNVLTKPNVVEKRGYTAKLRIWDVNEYVMDALVFRWIWESSNYVRVSDIAKRKILEFINEKLAQKSEIPFYIARNISKLFNRQYIDIYSKLEITKIWSENVFDLCKMFSCSVEEISRLSNRGANFIKDNLIVDSNEIDLNVFADLFGNYTGSFVFQEIVISGTVDFRKFSSNRL